jgi:hypothetical protein
MLPQKAQGSQRQHLLSMAVFPARRLGDAANGGMEGHAPSWPRSDCWPPRREGTKKTRRSCSRGTTFCVLPQQMLPQKTQGPQRQHLLSMAVFPARRLGDAANGGMEGHAPSWPRSDSWPPRHEGTKKTRRSCSRGTTFRVCKM